MIAPLRISLPLTLGETPNGYISRMAKLYMTTARDLCSDLGMRWPFLCTGYLDQLERLSWLTGHPLEPLSLCSARRLNSGNYKVGHTISSKGAFKKSSSRFCPCCVTEAIELNGVQGVFQLLEWSVTCLHRCEVHGVQFIELPSAPHVHEAYDFASQVTAHLDRVKNAAESANSLPATEFESYLRNRIWHGAKEDWLKDLELSQVFRACLTLGAALAGIEDTRDIGLAVDDERMLCQRGFEHLNRGPSGLVEALEQLIGQGNHERPYFTADLGPFYCWLHSELGRDELRHLVDATRNHIFNSYPVALEKQVLGEQPAQEIWLTMEEARRRSGFGAIFLKKLLGYLEGTPLVKSLSRTDVRVDELAAAQDYWEGLINLKDASEQMAIRPEQVKQLVSVGIFNPVKIASSLIYLQKSEVLEVLHKISALPDIGQNGEFLPIREFCRLRGVGLHKVVAAFVAGKLGQNVRRGPGQGVHSLEICHDALPRVVQRIENRDLTLSETASHLKIGVTSVRLLRDAGYLEQVRKRNPDTRHLKSFITQSSIRSFERQFITLGQMAAKQKVAPIHLAKKLDQSGFAPINCTTKLVRAYSQSDWSS